MTQDTATRVRTRLLLAEAAADKNGFSEFLVSNHEERLFGRQARKGCLEQLLRGLMADGALKLTKDRRFIPGPGFEQAMAAVLPPAPVDPVEILTPADVEAAASLATLTRDQELMSRLHFDVLEVLEHKRLTGKLERLDVDPGRIQLADEWNSYVDHGNIGGRLTQYIRRIIPASINSMTEYGQKPKADFIALLPSVNILLAGGTSFETLSMSAGLTAHDRDSGQELMVSLINWKMAFWTELPENDYEPVQLDIARKAAPVVRIDLEEGGPLLILSGRGGDSRITEALYKVHVEQIDSWHDLGSGEGMLKHAAETYARTGIMDISMGDIFPCPIRHHATGAIALSHIGEVVSLAEAAELEADGNEDWLAGNFQVETPGFGYHDGMYLEHMRICRQDRLVAVLAEHLNVDEAVATGVIEEALGDPYGKVYRDDTGALKHLWLAFSPSEERFADAVDRTEMMEKGGYGRPVALLSRDLVGFAPEEVRVLEVAPPAQAADLDMPTP